MVLLSALLPLMLSDATGAPVNYIAGIAEHTKNLKAEPRASLLIHEPVQDHIDIQTKARLCIMGTAKPIQEPEARADAWARYQARVPAASTYQQTHDFALWRIAPYKLRWIGGFGEIFWLRTEDFLLSADTDPLASVKNGGC